MKCYCYIISICIIETLQRGLFFAGAGQLHVVTCFTSLPMLHKAVVVGTAGVRVAVFRRLVWLTVVVSDALTWNRQVVSAFAYAAQVCQTRSVSWAYWQWQQCGRDQTDVAHTGACILHSECKSSNCHRTVYRQASKPVYQYQSGA